MRLQLLLCSLFSILFVVAPAGAANLSQTEVSQYIAQAKTFLCDKSFCLHQEVSVVVEESEGYYAYYHALQKKVSLSPTETEIEAQLDLVHEFTHAYRHQFNNNEEVWLDEGLAKLMEYQYSGVWPVSYQERLRKNPTLILSNDRQADYGREGDGYPSSFWLMLYLYNHLGGEKFLKKVLESPLSGWDNVEHAAQELRQSGDISEPAEFLNRGEILFAFSVSMWMNDEFKAEYNLFALDPQYESLAKASASEPKIPSPLLKTKTLITYSHHYAHPDGCEIYAVHQGQTPLVKAAVANEAADIFIDLCI